MFVRCALVDRADLAHPSAVDAGRVRACQSTIEQRQVADAMEQVLSDVPYRESLIGQGSHRAKLFS